jgi:uncharacterized protein (DUF2249 family)
MGGLVDLRGMEFTEMLERAVMSLEEVEEGEFLDFIIDSDSVKFIQHIEEITSKYEIKEMDGYTIVKLWKERPAELETREEFKIDENTNVGKLIERYPEALDILVRYGFTPLKNPVLRKVLAKTITLGRARKLKGLSDEEFKNLLEALEKLAEIEK